MENRTTLLYKKWITHKIPCNKTLKYNTVTTLPLFKTGFIVSCLFLTISANAQNIDAIEKSLDSELFFYPSSLPLSQNEENELIKTKSLLPLTKAIEPDNALTYQAEPSLYLLLSAELAYEEGNITEAIATYKEQSFTQYATPVFERALTLSMKHEPINASLDFALEWHKKNPNHVPAWFYVAHLALQAHDYQQAGETLSQILEYDAQADLTEILNGIYPEDEEDQRQLLTTLQIIDTEQNSAISVLEAGLLLKFNEAKIALIHIERAIKLNPDNEPYIILNADILKKLKRHDELLFFLDTARKRLPEQKALYLYQIRYLLNNKNVSSSANNKKAWSLLLETHKQFPDDPEITLLAALVSLDIEEYKVGDSLLTSLLDRPAFIDQAYYYLGICAERQNKLADASAYFKKVFQVDLVLAARKKVIDFELRNGNTDNAIEVLENMRAEFGNVIVPNESNITQNNSNDHVSDNCDSEYIDNEYSDNQHAIDISIESYILQAKILNQIDKNSQATELMAQAYLKHANNSKLVYIYSSILEDVADYPFKKKLLEQLLGHIQDGSIDDSTNTTDHEKIKQDYDELLLLLKQ